MGNFDESDRPSKLHLITQAVSNALKKGDLRAGAQTKPGAAAQPGAEDEEKTRTWDPEEWEEDQRYVEAMDLLAAQQKRDALKKLVGLYQDDPSHLYGRQQLFSLALELGETEHVRTHIEWVLGFFTQQGDTQALCTAYRNTRLALPDLEWSEKALVQALIAGDKAKDGRVVVDATKLLLNRYPQSAAMPRAFIASADVQRNEGRPDLAKVTLKNVIARFPLDPLVQMAERKLAELG